MAAKNFIQPVDNKQLKNALGQKQPAILYLYDGTQKRDKPLEDAFQREAKRNADNLLVVQVDVAQNPDVHAKYNRLEVPALVTLTRAFFGRKTKSEAENIRPADVRAHVGYLLRDEPLPISEEDNGNTPKGKGGAGHVTDKDFRKAVLKSKVPVLVDFWAPWCQPCLAVAPFIDKMAKEYSGRVKVVKLNVDENPVMKHRYQVMSIPTLIMFDGGSPIERRTGANPAVIKTMIEESLL